MNNQTFIINHPNKGEPMTPCMDIYKANIQYYVSLDKLKLTIVVIEDLKNKEMVGNTFYPTASMRTLKYFLSYAYNNRSRLNRLDFIELFLQANAKYRVFVNLDSRYVEYFQ